MEDWQLSTMEVLGSKCKVCGTSEHLIIHHVDGDPLNNDSRNLMLLCNSCHRKLHCSKDSLMTREDHINAYGWWKEG